MAIDWQIEHESELTLNNVAIRFVHLLSIIDDLNDPTVDVRGRVDEFVVRASVSATSIAAQLPEVVRASAELAFTVTKSDRVAGFRLGTMKSGEDQADLGPGLFLSWVDADRDRRSVKFAFGLALCLAEAVGGELTGTGLQRVSTHADASHLIEKIETRELDSDSLSSLLGITTLMPFREGGA